MTPLERALATLTFILVVALVIYAISNWHDWLGMGI